MDQPKEIPTTNTVPQSSQQSEKIIQTKKQQQEKDKQQQDINNLLNQFEGGDLNLTGQQPKQDQKQDEKVMKQIKEQYEKFMKQMTKEGEENQGDQLGIGNLGKAFQELLSGLGEGDETGKHIGEKFQNMFKNLENPDNFENAASELLNQFMDRSLLEQPLKQTKANYQKYFADNGGKNNVPQNYQRQVQIIDKLLISLKQHPQQKSKLIQLFTQLQGYGNPPAGIAPSFGSFGFF